MRTDLNTKILEKLSGRVERLCRAINDPDAVAMGKDWSWAELTHEALPKLEAYIFGANDEMRDSERKASFCSGLDLAQGKSPVETGLANQQWTLGEWSLQEGCFAGDRNNDTLRLWHEPTQRGLWISERDAIILAELLTRRWCAVIARTVS